MPETAGVDKELAALRKEVYEARSLIIKTDNLLKTFHAELKTIASRQDAAERRHFVGHVAAYVVIGALAAAGAWWVSGVAASTERARAERSLKAAKTAQDAAKKAEKAATAGLARRDRASREALDAYHLLTSKDPKSQARGLERYAAIAPSDLPPFASTVLDDVSRSVRQQAAQDAYDAGLKAYHQGDMKAAAAALTRFYTFAGPLPPGWQADERRLGAYYLGAASNQAGEHPPAVKWLRQYLAGSGSRATQAYASLLLGDSLSALGRNDDAKAAWTAGLKYESQGKVASLLRRRLGQRPAPKAAAPKQPAAGDGGGGGTAPKTAPGDAGTHR